jgi:hypothetical protein
LDLGDKLGTPCKDGCVTTPPGWIEVFRGQAPDDRARMQCCSRKFGRHAKTAGRIRASPAANSESKNEQLSIWHGARAHLSQR